MSEKIKAHNEGKNEVKPAPHVKVEIEKQIWNQGEKLSKPFVQYFDALKGWPDFVRTHRQHGYTINKVEYPKGVKGLQKLEEILGTAEEKKEAK